MPLAHTPLGPAHPPTHTRLPHIQTLAYCGEAIRLESVANTGDAASALDNTIWFDKIIDSVVGERGSAAAPVS